MKVSFVILSLSLLVACATASQIFPFNIEGVAGSFSQVDDGCSPYLSGYTQFFGQSFYDMSVCNNGIISLGSSVGSTGGSFPYYGSAIIAPFWTDIDTRTYDGSQGGVVYYEMIATGTALSSQYESFVRSSDPLNGALQSFTASRIYQATWYQVGLYSHITFPNNTFQAAIVTDDAHYFVVFNYPEGGINNIHNYPIAGVNLGDSYNYLYTPYSKTDFSTASTDSNVGTPGVWVYDVTNSVPIPTNPPTESESVSQTPSQSRTPSQTPSLPYNALVYRNSHGKSNGLGRSVAAEGSEAVVAQPFCSDKSPVGKPCGKVYILQTGPAGWTLKQYFQYLGRLPYSNFGTNILFENGWLLVQSSAFSNYSTGVDETAIYGFKYSPSAGRYTRKFSVTSPLAQAYQSFGAALAMDGNFTFISSPYAGTDGYYGNGIVFGYNYPKSIDHVSGTPRHFEIKSPYLQNYESFGHSVAAKGGIVVVSTSTFYYAPVYVFSYTFESATYLQTIYPPYYSSYNFGSKIILDGYNLFISSPSDSVYQYGAGSVSHYTLNIYNTFDYQNYFTPYDYIYNGNFGVSMTYNKERQFLVVGATTGWNCGTTCYNKGAVYVLQNNGFGYWYQNKHSLGVRDGSDLFGFSVATNSNGLVVGAPYDHVHGQDRGAVYLIAY